MVNQVTPYGSLTYSQTGQSFTPSETGQTYYYNPSTGEYASTMPTVSGGASTGTPMGWEQRTVNGQTLWVNPQTGQTSTTMPSGPMSSGATSSLAPGWQAVTGSMTPSYTATTTLSPEQQAILDQQNAAYLNLAETANQQSAYLQDYLATPLDLSGAPELQTSLGPDYVNSLDAYQGVQDDTYNAIVARQQPTMDANQTNLESQLYAKGLSPGTQAWDSEMARLSAANNDFYNSAYLSSQDAALQQAQFTNDAIMNEANFGNAARTQYMNEAYAERNQPINESTALMSGTQVTSPNFVATPQTQVDPVDYTGLVSDQYAADSKAYSGMMGGLFGLAAAPFGTAGIFSDRRMKKDIEEIGRFGRLPIYAFRYVWEGDKTTRRTGFMSDDVRKVAPHAVIESPGCFDMVDYRLAMEAA